MGVNASPLADASATLRGAVNLLAQTFAGNKTFASTINSSVTAGSFAFYGPGIGHFGAIEVQLSGSALTIDSAGNFTHPTGFSFNTLIKPAGGFTNNVPNTASQKAFVFNNTVTLGSAGNMIAEFQNNGTKVFGVTYYGRAEVDDIKFITAGWRIYGGASYFSIDTPGGASALVVNASDQQIKATYGFNTDGGYSVYGQSILSYLYTAAPAPLLRGACANGGGRAALSVGNVAVLAETEDMIRVANGLPDTQATCFAVKPSGKIGQAGTDGNATAGAQTINKPCGKGKIANAATTCVITNSLVAAGSVIRIQWEGDHGAARSWVTPAAGSFTVTLSTAASAATVFNFEVTDIL